MDHQMNSNNDLVKMTTHDIQSSGWGVFAPTFSATHVGWLTSIGISGGKAEHAINAIEGRNLPLRDVTIDLKDNQKTAVITVGHDDDNLLTHEVRNVSRIAVFEIEDDKSVVLQIDDDGGQTTSVKLSPASLMNPPLAVK